MKKLSWLIACLITTSLVAQQKLMVAGKSTDRYVVYATSGLESLQNVSNQFGQSVSKLAAYNKINVNQSTPIAKGTKIKIPITNNSFLQKKSENSEPIFHLVTKGENLYKISQTFYKVPVASLKVWNNLKSNTVKNGQSLIVGYMVNAKSVTLQKNEPKKDIPAIYSTTLISATPPEKKYLDKKDPIMPSPVKKDGGTIITPVVVSKEIKPIEDKPSITPANKKVEWLEEYSPKEGDEGYFASFYQEKTKPELQQFHSGDASIFKSISGWTDRKFYVLVNDIEPKTIVRITGVNKKSICAMVLGPLPELKGSSDLVFRISNSAANALGIIDTKFPLTISYFE